MTDKRITQAPPPPTPLSGRGQVGDSFQVARERREQAIADTYEAPNWTHWLLYTHLSTFQAAALSLAIDPGSVRSEDHLTAELRGRLEAIRNCRDLLKGSHGHTSGDGWPEIRLDVFATWVVSTSWTVPEELRELAKRHSSTATGEPEKTSDSKGTKRPSAKQRHCAEILKALKDSGHEPKALPPWKKGCKWAPKQDAKKALKVGEQGQAMSQSVFDKNWSALSMSREIAEKRTRKAR